MCEWGNTKKLEVSIPARLSHAGIEYRKTVDIDSCIFPIVEALNNGGITTIACCCGHGKRPGSIVLEDERELVIMPDYESARKLDKVFQPIND